MSVSSPAAVVAPPPRSLRRSIARGGRPAVAVVLLAVFLAALATVRPPEVAGGRASALTLLAALLRPDLSPAFLLVVAEAALLTLAYAVAAMSVAVLVAVPGAVLLSGTLVRHHLGRRVTVAATRGVSAALRSVHELVWALLLLAVLGVNPLSGILALAIPSAAVLARVLGERLVDVPPAPLATLAAAGASPSQLLLYGRLPLAGADLAAHVLYRFECVVRNAAVLGFVGLGGIGYRVEIALADLRFEQVSTLLAALVALVAGLARGSARLRRSVR